MSGLIKVKINERVWRVHRIQNFWTLWKISSSKKSRSENFISKFREITIHRPSATVRWRWQSCRRWYGCCFSSAAPEWSIWIYRALTFLVISCPCALVISIPLSFFAGIGGASHEGVLVKGSNYLETLSQTKYVVFDKTGTMTQGVFEVAGIHHNTISQEDVLEYAALAECASSHPISKSLQRAYGKLIDRSRVTDIEEISGNGVTAKVDGEKCRMPNAKN